MSQESKLLELLSDYQEHSTPEILEKVYGNDHLGVARISARVLSLNRQIKKERGLLITDPNPIQSRPMAKRKVWAYRLTPVFRQTELPREKLGNKALLIFHDCRTKNQPQVCLMPSIDPTFLVGTCHNCREVIYKRI